MSDDEIAGRIAKTFDEMGVAVPTFFDAAEAYRLAYIPDVRERAKARRQQKRVRALVFAALGVADRATVEK